MAWKHPVVHYVERIEADYSSFPTSRGGSHAQVILNFYQRNGQSAVMEMFTQDLEFAEDIAEAINAAMETLENDRQTAINEPASDAAQKRGCTCTVCGVNGDPDQDVLVDKWCPLHGKDPDHALEEQREWANDMREAM